MECIGDSRSPEPVLWVGQEAKMSYGLLTQSENDALQSPFPKLQTFCNQSKSFSHEDCTPLPCRCYSMDVRAGR